MFNGNTKSLVNPNEFEAIKAPAWLGGLCWWRRSLFNGRKDKGFKIKLEKDNDDDKWNKIYPPPQRAFMLEDDVSSTSTKQKISKYTNYQQGR